MQLITNILSARTLLQKGHVDIGYKVWNKAKIIAKELKKVQSLFSKIYHSENRISKKQGLNGPSKKAWLRSYDKSI